MSHETENELSPPETFESEGIKTDCSTQMGGYQEPHVPDADPTKGEPAMIIHRTIPNAGLSDSTKKAALRRTSTASRLQANGSVADAALIGPVIVKSKNAAGSQTRETEETQDDVDCDVGLCRTTSMIDHATTMTIVRRTSRGSSATWAIPATTHNPFTHNEAVSSGCLNFMKRLSCAFILFPIRFLLLFISGLLAICVCAVANACCCCCGSTAFDADCRPMPQRNAGTRWLVRCSARLWLWCLGYWWIERTDVRTDTIADSERVTAIALQIAEERASQSPIQRPMSPRETPTRPTPSQAAHQNALAPSHTMQVQSLDAAKAADAEHAAAPVIVANHVGLVDILYLASQYNIMAVGAMELVELCFIRPVSRALQIISVDRERHENRKEVSNEIIRRTTWRYSQTGDIIAQHGLWPSLVIFPEGTTNNGRGILEFKPGAFLGGVPVQPVVFQLPFHSFDPHWVGPATLHGTLLGMMLQWNNRLHALHLPPIAPTAIEEENPDIFAQRVRLEMAHASGLPLIDRGLFDTKLDQFCSVKLHMPQSAMDRISVFGVVRRLEEAVLQDDVQVVTKRRETEELVSQSDDTGCSTASQFITAVEKRQREDCGTRIAVDLAKEALELWAATESALELADKWKKLPSKCKKPILDPRSEDQGANGMRTTIAMAAYNFSDDHFNDRIQERTGVRRREIVALAVEMNVSIRIGGDAKSDRHTVL